MSLRVLIVPDKFKGTLTAAAAAESIAEGWRKVQAADRLTLLPMSDGGDGFGEVMGCLLGADIRINSSVNAAHEPLNAQWWWQSQTRTAIIESARVIGLAQLPPGQFHPRQLDTFGLGNILRSADDIGAEQCLVGIGGSATNDGGFGMARAVGWKFLDENGRPIDSWTDLSSLAGIEPPRARNLRCKYVVAVDVQNPLLGPAGATRIYGPQKGIQPEEMPAAERCLEQLAKVVSKDLGIEAASEPGTGAAGGLGFGLRCFLGASLESGFKLFATHARLEEQIRSSDLVITAEGAIDRSTLMGKGVGEVAVLCRRHGVPCLGLAGTLPLSEAERAATVNFSALHGIVPDLTDSEQAKAQAAHWLRELATRVAREWRPRASNASCAPP